MVGYRVSRYLGCSQRHLASLSTGVLVELEAHSPRPLKWWQFEQAQGLLGFLDHNNSKSSIQLLCQLLC